jgi:hypothetical protein
MALFASNPRLARRRHAITLDEILRTEIGQARTYELAVYVATDLMDYRVSRRAIAALEASFMESRRNMAQGFAAVVLCEALKQCGHGDKASEIFSEYINRFRREQLPLGPGIIYFFVERLDKHRAMKIQT